MDIAPMAQELGNEFFFLIQSPFPSGNIDGFETRKYPRQNGAGNLNWLPLNGVSYLLRRWPRPIFLARAERAAA